MHSCPKFILGNNYMTINIAVFQICWVLKIKSMRNLHKAKFSVQIRALKDTSI